MGAPSETYVDPSIAGNSGAGTVGDPYGDLQYALDTMTRDSTNGDRINIKAGTDEILSAAISLATYGTPTVTTPLIFQGYTSVAGDGGIGGISGNGSVSIYSAIGNYISFVDLHLHNCGSAIVLYIGSFGAVINCDVENTTGNGITAFLSCVIMDNYIHNIGGFGVLAGQRVKVASNRFENGANSFTATIFAQTYSVIIENVLKVSGSTDGINMTNDDIFVASNSIWSDGGVGTGIVTSVSDYGSVINNIVEGFSGVGGVGIGATSATRHLSVYANNKVYNNTTNFGTVVANVDRGGNAALLASPFTDAANGDFSVDTTVQAASWPSTFTQEGTNTQYKDSGALQRQEPAATETVVAVRGFNTLLRM